MNSVSMTSTWQKWPTSHFLEPEVLSKVCMILVFGNSGNSCLIVTTDQMVYSLGNDFRVLYGTNSLRSNRANLIVELCGKNIKTFAYGETHVLALTTNGEVYAWGNYYLQLGYSGDSLVPKKVQIQESMTDFVVDIACGAYNSVALTKNGLVYVWGKEAVTDSSTQTDVTHIKHLKLSADNLIKCVSISCGSEHSMAVMKNGQVYGWGLNSVGQLGNGSTDASSSPKKVENLSEIVIVKVVCGMNHTLALSDAGSLYSWGDNTFGQLGFVCSANYISRPMAIPKLEHVLDMAASNCSNISVAMQEGHKIFMWGQCLEHSITCPTLTSVDSIHDVFALYTSPHIMHEPLVISNDDKYDKGKKETMPLLDNLEAALDDKNTSDLVFEVQGKHIYVHKTILRIRSEYFKRMFEGSWKENNDSVVKEDQFCYVVYRAFLKFLYTGKIDIPADNAVELLKLADFYNDNHLTIRCADVIMRGISTDNAAFIYSAAVKYNAMALKERCMKFVVGNMTRIIESTSFTELSHGMTKTFITEANKFNIFKT